MRSINVDSWAGITLGATFFIVSWKKIEEHFFKKQYTTLSFGPWAEITLAAYFHFNIMKYKLKKLSLLFSYYLERKLKKIFSKNNIQGSHSAHGPGLPLKLTFTLVSWNINRRNFLKKQYTMLAQQYRRFYKKMNKWTFGKASTELWMPITIQTWAGFSLTTHSNASNSYIIVINCWFIFCRPLTM